MKQSIKSAKLFSLVLLVLLVGAFVIVVPAAAQDCTWTHRVRFGDTLGTIAQNYDTTVSDLLALNPQLTNANLIVQDTDICISTTETPPPLYSTNYTVTFGDSLAALAQRFGVTLRELARANGIGNVNLIVEGQSLTVPEAP
jgi:LysM repeat protein